MCSFSDTLHLHSLFLDVALILKKDITVASISGRLTTKHSRILFVIVISYIFIIKLKKEGTVLCPDLL